MSIQTDEIIVHVLSQEGQPYGSVRRCCDHCGAMIWASSGRPLPLHVDNWADWRARPNNCGARPVEPKRPMRAFAEGLLWLDRFRAVEAEAAERPDRSGPKGLPPLSADEIYALAYAKGYHAGQESVLDRFVGCEDLSRDEIWKRLADAIAWSNEPVDRPAVRPEGCTCGRAWNTEAWPSTYQPCPVHPQNVSPFPTPEESR